MREERLTQIEEEALKIVLGYTSNPHSNPGDLVDLYQKMVEAIQKTHENLIQAPRR